jgi:aldehyde:ferredoxin oxidoreductase
MEPLKESENVLRKYIGGYGLGLKLLIERLPTGIISTSPENVFILTTGPLTGVVSVPCANNATITALNGETEFTPARSHSHGYFAPHLKFAGYDGLILEGQSEEPIILSINNEKVEFLSAQEFWGLDSHETEDAVKSTLGNKKASVAAIGPAGENLVRGSMIGNDYNHSFSHSGVGRILGSKKVKAIAVYGTNKVPAANTERLKEVTRKWHHYLRDLSPVTSFVKDAGIPKSNYLGFISSRLLL